jgi:hypothetical protein
MRALFSGLVPFILCGDPIFNCGLSTSDSLHLLSYKWLNVQKKMGTEQQEESLISMKNIGI